MKLLEIFAGAFRDSAIGFLGSVLAFLAVSWVTERYCRDVSRTPRPMPTRDRQAPFWPK
jgi:hypothetical protein